jgi:cob(I)alamin adenosyltransferase
MKIYTKQGDRGSTSLYKGHQVEKADPIIEVIGVVDECNSALGVALSQFSLEELLDPLRTQVLSVQSDLFDLGAHLASIHLEGNAQKGTFEEKTEQLELWIDQMESHLPPLKHFILPGGDPGGAQLHFARSLCRRAERCLAPQMKEGNIHPFAFIFLNRLSDYLFMLARLVNQITHSPEIPWISNKKDRLNTP